jgi:hypothetical protein
MATDKTNRPPLPPRPLTAQQQAFVLAYVETGNAAEAYRRAYNCKEGRSAQSIGVAAYRLLKNPRIAAQAKAQTGLKDSLRYKAQRLKEQAIAAGNVAPLVDQVRAAHAARHQLTVDDIVDRLEEARTLAVKKGQLGAAVSATAELRRLLFGDKTAIDLTSDGRRLELASPGELAAALLASMPSLSLPAPVPIDVEATEPEDGR